MLDTIRRAIRQQQRCPHERTRCIQYLVGGNATHECLACGDWILITLEERKERLLKAASACELGTDRREGEGTMTDHLDDAWEDATQYLIAEDFPLIVTAIRNAMLAAHDDVCHDCSQYVDWRARCSRRAHIVALKGEAPE